MSRSTSCERARTGCCGRPCRAPRRQRVCAALGAVLACAIFCSGVASPTIDIALVAARSHGVWSAGPWSAPSSARARRRTSPRARRRHCGGVVPLRVVGGTWDVARPPYFFPNASQCDPPPVLDAAAIRSCLARVGVRRPARQFLLGNSFARGAAFALHAWMTNGTMTSRLDQLGLCTKRRDARGDANELSCRLDAGRGTTLSVLWRYSLGDGYGDFCDGVPAAVCHAQFFGADPDDGDVAIAAMGLRHVELAGRLRDDANVSATFLGELDAFVASGVFRGTLVWPTVAPADPAGGWGSFNGRVETLNAAVVAGLRNRSSRARGGGPRVVVLDHAHFIAGLPANQTWRDAIHPPDESYLALVFHALAAVCGPGAGRDVSET